MMVLEKSSKTDTPEPFIAFLLSSMLLLLTPSAVALIIMATVSWPAGHWRLALLAVVAAITIFIARSRIRRIRYLLRTLSGLLEALREGDYTLRGKAGTPLGSVIYDVNVLATHLQRQRIHLEESLHLMNKTLNALGGAVLVFDDKRTLRFLNPAAAALLNIPMDAAMGCDAMALGLDMHLDSPRPHTQTWSFPSSPRRLHVYSSQLVYEGRKGSLLVINDIEHVLRDEERTAWQRLLRVLSHEVNNSLAPISSIADTLRVFAAKHALTDAFRVDLVEGLDVIADRAAALNRFLSGYSRLNRLPAPDRRDIDLGELVRRIVRLEPGRAEAEPGSALVINADPDQIEQALLNLLKNAIEASTESREYVRVRWREEQGHAIVEVIDAGVGPPPSENLFVPFFTTKPGGSGIGLALARAIAEMHQGYVSLEARPEGAGAIARLVVAAHPSDEGKLPGSP